MHTTATFFELMHNILSVNYLKKSIKKIVGFVFKLIFYLFYSNKNIRIILMYHRVVEKLPDSFLDSGMYVTSRSFEKHIQELMKYFNVVSLQEFNTIHDNNKNLCAITFDDGWRDNYYCALPIIKKYKVPATVFLSADYVGTYDEFWFQTFWEIAKWSNERNLLKPFTQYLSSFIPDFILHDFSNTSLKKMVFMLKKLDPQMLDQVMHDAHIKFCSDRLPQRNVLNWDEIHEMSTHGFYFGSHGLNHFILPALVASQKEIEIVESYEKLSKKIDQFLPFFSYPNGDLDNESVNFVISAGYLGAVTTKLGLNPPSTNHFMLNRIAMHEDISSSSGLFWFRILQAVFASLKA